MLETPVKKHFSFNSCTLNPKHVWMFFLLPTSGFVNFGLFESRIQAESLGLLLYSLIQYHKPEILRV